MFGVFFLYLDVFCIFWGLFLSIFLCGDFSFEKEVCRYFFFLFEVGKCICGVLWGVFMWYLDSSCCFLCWVVF